jgi:hypothetical protein
MTGLAVAILWIRGAQFTACLGLLVLLRALLKLQEQQPPHPHASLRQLHHGYYGFALTVLTPALLLVSRVWWVVAMVLLLQALGLWWLLDDFRQHVAQWRDPGYRSWWHNWAHARGLT